jgi:hypothetical protein
VSLGEILPCIPRTCALSPVTLPNSGFCEMVLKFAVLGETIYGDFTDDDDDDDKNWYSSVFSDMYL